MNLEAIEQKCLKYLQEVVNPLVPVDVLLRYLHRDAAMAELSEETLVAFLRKHELFRVVDSPLASTAAQTMAELATAGFNTKPRALLCTRVPTESEWMGCLREEVVALVEALQAAFEDAQETGKKERVRRVAPLLERAEALLARLEGDA